MKRIGVSFVDYYNRKYRTTGCLFQDRFKSEKVESDKSTNSLKYAHQNPVKAQMVKQVEQWKWNSCLGYYGKGVYPEGLSDNEARIAIVHIISEIEIAQMSDNAILLTVYNYINDNITER